MLIEKSSSIKKFAIAFLNNYEDKISEEYIEIIENLIEYCKKNKMLKAIISRPSLSLEKKHAVINIVSEKLNVPNQIKKLIFVLLHHRKVDLFPGILKKIVFLHKQKIGIFKFSVFTSHELEESEKNNIIKFLSSNIRNQIEISFRIDKSLISGIKITSPTMLLEHSVAKKIRQFKKTLLQEEIW